MKINNLGQKNHSENFPAQSRLLISQSRQKQKNRQQSMLYRAADEVGVNL